MVLHLGLQKPLDVADQRQSLVNAAVAVAGAAHHLDTACCIVVEPIASTFQYDSVLVYPPQDCAAQQLWKNPPLPGLVAMPLFVYWSMYCC